MDKKDREILYELDLDARKTISHIAKQVKLSKEVVGYRIKRMTEEGIITGYYCVVDVTKLGYTHARVFMKFKNISPEEEASLVHFFVKNPRFWWVGPITSSLYDLGVACWVRDVLDFHILKEDCFGRYRNKIDIMRDSFYSNIYSWSKKYLNENHDECKATLISGRSQDTKYDENDIKILRILSDDARIPVVNLAEKVGLSITAVVNRLDKLIENKVILGFRPKINLDKLGYYWYKVEFQLEEYKCKKALLNYFASHPNAVYAYESIGGGDDLEVEFEVKSHNQFKEIVDEIRKKFKESIRSYIYYIWIKEEKVSYFPMTKEVFSQMEKEKSRKGI
jgi:Lrp/AsnC family leucine-responsive transcriptional regulator